MALATPSRSLAIGRKVTLFLLLISTPCPSVAQSSTPAETTTTAAQTTMKELCEPEPAMHVQGCGLKLMTSFFELDDGVGPAVDAFDLPQGISTAKSDIAALETGLSDTQADAASSIDQLSSSLSQTSQQLQASLSELDVKHTMATEDLAERASSVETVAGQLEVLADNQGRSIFQLTEELSMLKIQSQSDVSDVQDLISALEAKVDRVDSELSAAISETTRKLSETQEDIAECAQTGQVFGGDDRKSQSNPHGCFPIMQAGSNPFTASADCFMLHKADPSLPSGFYYINPGSPSPDDAFQAYCDMTTDGGGWTIIMATDGNASSGVRLTSNSEVTGDPLQFEAYNINRKQKMRIDSISSEIILVSSSDSWLRVSSNFDFVNLNKNNRESWTPTMVDSSDGQRDTTAALGWSNARNSQGGDFGIRDDPSFDFHNNNFRYLQEDCKGHYLYDYGPGYDVHRGLGDWEVTKKCDSSAGGSLAFYIGLRGPVFYGRSRDYPAKSCKELLTVFETQGRELGIMNGKYWIKPTEDIDAFEAWCDFVTSGGGWTVIYSWDSTDPNWPSLLADGDAGRDPISHNNYNLGQLKKMAIDAVSSETLFKRTTGVWLRLSGPLRLENLRRSNQHVDLTATARASNGASRSVTYGWSNFYIDRGGDFGIRTGPFDHHSKSFYHLQGSCSGHYIYNYGSNAWRAGYDVNSNLGNWGRTHGCHSSPGGNLAFWAGLR